MLHFQQTQTLGLEHDQQGEHEAKCRETREYAECCVGAEGERDGLEEFGDEKGGDPGDAGHNCSGKGLDV